MCVFVCLVISTLPRKGFHQANRNAHNTNIKDKEENEHKGKIRRSLGWGERQGKEVRGRRLRGWLKSQAHEVLWSISSLLKRG